MIRIPGFGSAPGASGGDGGKRGGGERRKRFVRDHRVGQIVRGRVLENEDETHSWITIDGAELLARIGARAVPGTSLLFRIVKLSPEIVLQVIHGGAGAGLSAAARSFWTCRDRLENALADPETAPRLTTEPMAPGAFLKALASPERRELADALGHAVEEANAWLARFGPWRLVCAPWLAPRARGLEILVRREEALQEYAFGFTDPDLGFLEVRVIAGHERAVARALLRDPARLGDAEARIAPLLQALFSRPTEIRPPAPLPPRASHGLLAELLAADPGLIDTPRA